MGFAALSPAALSNSVRNRIFDRKKWGGPTVNRLFSNLSRIVLDPRYRGAGIAADFLRAVTMEARTPYVEMITAMGSTSRFWEKAGYVDYGPTATKKNDRWSEVYGTMYNRDATSATVKSQSKVATMRYFLAKRDEILLETGRSV